MKKVLFEAVVVAALGITLALAANGLSSRGLKLSRNYFPGAKPSGTSMATVATPAAQGTNAPQAAHDPIARLREKGMQVVDCDKAVALYQDPQHEQGTIIFIDARNDEHYRQGHIPGAYQFDHIYPEKYLPTILPACNLASQIIIYCNGGDCELSEFAAEFLRGSAGIPNNKIFIFAGGIKDWEARSLPMETGERKSGQFRTASK